MILNISYTKKLIFFLLVFFEILGLAKSSLAQSPIDNLQPGQWYEVPNSKIRDVIPSPLPYPSSDDARSITSAWNSAAFDTKRNWYIITGGGHADYSGNEIYVFDINTLGWTRIWGPSYNLPSPTQSWETYLDGTPGSRHTYDGLEYLPNVDKFWVHGGSLWHGGGDSKATWMFDFDTLTWSRKADYALSKLEMTSAYDPITGNVYVDGPSSAHYLQEYNPVLDTWTTRGGGSTWIGYGQNAAIDYNRRKYISVGRGAVYAFTLTSSGTITRQQLNTTGNTEIIGVAYPGLEYDPVSDRIVAWNGGSYVYTLNLDTLVWTKVPPAATNTVIPPQADANGVFGKWRYIPSKNAFIVVNSIDQNVYIYKLSSGSPSDSIPPTASITAPTSGSTVSGSSVIVSANAQDNVGVVGVQFKLDGVNLSLEDTTSPYSISWNTTQTTNGPHTLTATARDAAGNQTTSSGITVTVNNAISDTQAPTIPTNLVATAVSSSQINLSWTASTDNVGVTGYRIYRCQGAGCTPSTQNATTANTSYSDTGLTASTTYRYTVSAYDAAGNNSSQSTIVSTTTQSSTLPGQINIPLKTWVARPLPPGIGEAPCANYGCKHMRLAHNLVNGLIYFCGGDYTGTPIVETQSGRSEIYSYSITQDKWTLEHPYCAAPGEVQAGRPDEVGWVYDTNRNIFWMAPGYMWGAHPVCSSIQVKDELMSFDPVTRKWTDPPRKNLCSDFGVCGEATKFAQYDPVKDQIIQFYGSSPTVVIYDIESDAWTFKTFPGNMRFGMEYTAMDLENRHIYLMSPFESLLYRYDMDTQTFTNLGPTPAPTYQDATMPVWDSINKVLLWPQILHNQGGALTFHVYHPDTNTWEANLPINHPDALPAGLGVIGNHAIFDPYQNVLLLMGGGLDNVGANKYLFLYRYGNGSGAPDTTPPAAPTGVTVN